jgi:serine/threonine protein kinase/Tfp pilus assembly protein PilF
MTTHCPKCKSENTDTARFCSNCAAPLQPSEEISVPTQTIEAPRQELTTGSTFAGRYQIIEELGKGGMGKVYKAQDTEIKEKVALKLIKPEISADKKTIERFQNELKFARKIGHRNVCRMYDLNKEEGSYYITMEYVSGEDLKSFIKRVGQLPSGKAISVAKQVCEGLSEAHRLGVVHRDLKPSNIMIDKDGNARIMDFGIARSLKEKGITGAGVMIGTPEYMSPEQVEGKEIDQRTDIYSLGVILYEMVTGRVPFEGETALTIAVKHKTEVPKDPREYNTQLSEDLSRVILRCLEKEKEKRYQSAGEIRSELTNIEAGIPTTEQVIPERKPFTSREITVQFNLKKLFIPASIVIAIVIIAVVIWQLLPQKEAIPPPTGKPSLVIMYFENNTGNESLNHYRKAISDLLITDLSQSRYLDVIGGDQLFNILEDLNLLEAKNYSSKALRDVASRGRASYILQGNYTKAEDAFRISVMLHEASTMKRVSSEMFEGTGEKSIFSMVDRITKTIKSNFEISVADLARDIDENIENITTSSTEALKYYSEGRKYHNSGNYRESIQLMERAVEIDPEFAMALRSLAMSYSNLSMYNESQKYITKALELADRLPERERFQIMGDFYGQTERTYDKAIKAYEGLLELYPEDTTGNHNLGIRYHALEQWDKAIERYEIAKKYNTQFYDTYLSLAEAYRAKQMYGKAKEVLEYYLANFGDHDSVHRGLAHLYINQGRLDLALDEADKAFILDPGSWNNYQLKGDIFLYQGDLVQAEEEYQNMLKGREPMGQGWGRQRMSVLYKYQGKFGDALKMFEQALALARMVGQRMWEAMCHYGLADVYFASGHPEEAQRECEEALSIARETDFLSIERPALALKGHVLLDMNSISEAQRTADELKKLIEEGLDEKIIRLYFHLAGRIELKKKNFPQAIEQFHKSLSLESFGPLHRSADFIDSLATAYYESGDLDKAMEQYERIAGLNAGRLGNGEIYVRSFYMLGKICEKQGNTVKAIEHYQKFLDLWKDADSGIVEVVDARKRLEALALN